ncbi:hypothetical protein ACN47E_003833 [Coniothyrium glycines]
MRLKTLNGAPTRAQLHFNEDSLLNPESCTSFALDAADSLSVSGVSTLDLKWRSVTASGAPRLRTEWSQPFLPGSNTLFAQQGLSSTIENNIDTYISQPTDGTSLLDTTIPFDESTIAQDDFLQHSLIFHDSLLSSQVLPDHLTVADDTDASGGSFLTTSFGPTVSDFSSPGRVVERPSRTHIPANLVTTTLSSLPSAQRLRLIYPQTPTPNLLCVLTTSPVQREVVVRKTGRKMNLWEISVADDTGPGFKVSFWLHPSKETNIQHSAQRALLQALSRVRTGDILLLHKIALTSYRDVVHGQSLSSAITRARTEIDILYSRGSHSMRIDQLPRTVLETFTRVKRWAKEHVATDSIAPRKRRGSTPSKNTLSKRRSMSMENDEYLPPDTMEGS